LEVENRTDLDDGLNQLFDVVLSHRQFADVVTHSTHQLLTAQAR
jgi:hypothetical protein